MSDGRWITVFSLTAGFGEGSGKQPKSSEKQEADFNINETRLSERQPRLFLAVLALNNPKSSSEINF
jgi:hypothetical protein